MTIDERHDDASARRQTRDRPDALAPVTQMVLRLFRLNKIISSNADRCVRDEGLDLTEFQVLAMLRRAPEPHELMPTAVHDYLQISSGGLTKVVTRLEQRGLIARTTSPTDGRSKPIRLTAKGRSRVERVARHLLAADGALLSRGLTEQQIRMMIDLLKRLLTTLER